MIITGVAICFICWAIGVVFGSDMTDPHIPAVLHVGYVAGILLIVIGAILLLWGLIRPGSPIGGRRFWY